jgi:hypothetical protein
MVNPRYLTKSRFKLAIECPTKLFYYGKPKEYMDTSAEDAFLQALAEGGFQVGEMAKLLYPGGHEITSKVHQEALDQTAELVRQDAVVLYEPAFLFKGLFIRVDILVKTGNHFQLIEVKAKSYNPNEPDILGKRGGISTSYLPYLQDIAFQRYVLSNAHPEALIESFLMMADKSKVSPVDGLNQLFKIKRNPKGSEVVLAPDAATVALQCRDLLIPVPVDEYINTIFSEGIEFPGGFGMLPELSEAWAEAYRADRKISPVPTSECAKCQYRAKPGENLKSGLHECLNEAFSLMPDQVDQGTVLDLYSSARKTALLQQGKILLNTKTLSQDDIGYKTGDQGLTITERQWMQITGEIPEPYNQGGFYLDTVMIQKAMTSWTFPWHMIDFETSTTALPFFKGMRPYESTAFQFSHHIIHADGRVEHAGQFLMAEPNVNPNIEFVRALKAELDKDNGTVFRWATHENTILSHVLKQLNASKNPPEDKDALIGFIESILKDGNRAMVDLCDLAKRAYYHPDTKGSSSIKVVLPAVLKSSEFLKAKYSKPIYGSTQGIPSINYVDHTWWIARDGKAVGPYDLLKELGREISGSATDLDIADGGAAITAFSRLQFEDLDDLERQTIRLGLLRYCEVDTLAMVMITEAWREWAKEP